MVSYHGSSIFRAVGIQGLPVAAVGGHNSGARGRRDNHGNGGSYVTAFSRSAHFRVSLKYRRSGGGWPLRAGISKPSALRK